MRKMMDISSVRRGVKYHSISHWSFVMMSTRKKNKDSYKVSMNALN